MTMLGLLLLCTAAGATEEPVEVLIPSSLDGHQQRTLFYVREEAGLDTTGDPAPLLVSLHSWSTHCDTYDSFAGALEGCRERGWTFISPDFRGPNNRPEACASDLAVQDVLDAVAYAQKNARVDPNRIYVLGGSGGGHMALVMAHRAPDLWAAVSAWVPITELTDWHRFCSEKGYKYAGDVEQCLGGPPGDPDRDADSKKRSPLYHLAEAKGLSLDIQVGIHDGHGGRSVPIDHSLRAFNILAQANGQADQLITEADIAYLTQEAHVPDHLQTERQDEPGRKCPVLFRRTAGPARLTIFDGGHEIDPPTALAWLATNTKQ